MISRELRHALLILLPAIAQAQWTRIDSPAAELLTPAGEKPARELAARLEQIRAIFMQAGVPGGPLRPRVFIFASAAELHRFRENSDGFYFPGADRDYIALYAGPEANRVAFHEYTHLILQHSSVPLPAWFNEGTSEFYSTLQIEKSSLRVGEPIPAHLAALAGARLDAAQLGSFRHDALYYAESWALVHMLNLAPAWRDGLPRFILLLSQERPAEEAFREAFGKSLDDALRAVPLYLKSIRVLAIPTTIERPQTATSTRMTRDDAALARAGLAVELRRPELAETIIRGIVESPASEAIRGAIALAENRRDEAHRHLDRAIELGSRDASLYFEYAMLEHESGRPDSEWLRKTVAVDPGFADAQFLLGVRETDDGDYPSAIEHLRAATRVRPARSTYWHALGYAQAKSGARQDAIVSARRAIASAETGQEEQMARALLGLPGEPAAPRPARASVITPPSWQPRKGDTRIQGTLIHFDCGGDHPRIQVRSADGSIVILELLHPSEIELANSPQPTLQISCGPQSVPVIVDYERSTANVTRIEFRI